MPDISATVQESSHTRRQKQKKPVRRKNRRRLFLLFSLCFLLLIGGVAGAFFWKVDDAINVISQPSSVPSAVPVDPTYHQDKPLSLVILGRDTRPETGTMLTDVMIVSVLNPKTKQVTMLSIPRDTRVKIPGYSGYHKVNSVFANGDAERRQAEVNGRTPEEDGPSLTKKTLQELVGIPIQHYVEVDFEGFKAIVDELGGVEVNVDRKLVYDDPTDDTHINLEPGQQLLNGSQALGYVRHRHDNRGTKYYSSDYDRNRRQQEVIRAMVSKVTSFDGITKIFKLIDVGAQHVKTDLSPEQIKGLATDFMKMDTSSITTLENGAYWNAGTSYTYLPKEKLEEIRATLQAQMELSPDMIAELNKESVTRNSATESASSSSDKPKKKKQSTEVIAKPVQQTKPATETPATDAPATDPTAPPAGQVKGQNGEQTENQTTPPAGSTDPGVIDQVNQGTMPPPDIPVPEQTEQPPAADPSTTPPADTGEQTPPASTEEQGEDGEQT
ncbi:LCP family protein [Brevibacillus migulae]|uniref:LCP family protein n=1 Tax=Brevibacillus migulae TaxID=1644114 RepID=UPI00106E80A2|nr:LCP family protein [Brevibacillus migulae]